MDIKRKKSSLPEGADPLVGGVVKAKEFLSKNGTHITVCCVAVVVIVAGALIYNNMKESGIKKAQEIFGIGMLDYNADRFDDALVSFSDVANNFRSTPLGTMSAFMMGSIHLQQGNTDQAAAWLESAANGKDAGFVRGQALEGLAAVYETKGDAAAAVKYLEKALIDKSAAHRRPAIRWKLALLSQNNVSAASAYCNELISDTLAAAYHQKAENLLAAMNANK